MSDMTMNPTTIGETAHPLAALKAALRAHWLADPALAAVLGDRIVEVEPPAGPLPALIWGEGACAPEPGGVIITLAVRLVVAGNGTAALLALLARLQARLARLTPAMPTPTVPPHRLVSVVLRETRLAPEAERGRSEARLSLRAFLDLAGTET